MSATPTATEPVVPPEAFDGAPRFQRRTLHDHVLDYLRDMITEGRLAPGARINEGQVGAMLGVSRTPLREAIKTLASEGLVEILPAKGAVVRRIGGEEFRQIIEVLKGVEQLGGRLACARADDQEIDAIRRIHNRMMEHYAAGERLDYFKLNQAIHTAIAQASGNAVLAATHDTLQAQIKRMRYLGNGEPRNRAGAVAEHEEMINALAMRDADRLSNAIGRHLDLTWERIRDIV